VESDAGGQRGLNGSGVRTGLRASPQAAIEEGVALLERASDLTDGDAIVTAAEGRVLKRQVCGNVDKLVAAERAAAGRGDAEEAEGRSRGDARGRELEIASDMSVLDEEPLRLGAMRLAVASGEAELGDGTVGRAIGNVQ